MKNLAKLNKQLLTKFGVNMFVMTWGEEVNIQDVCLDITENAITIATFYECQKCHKILCSAINHHSNKIVNDYFNAFESFDCDQLETGFLFCQNCLHKFQKQLNVNDK